MAAFMTLLTATVLWSVARQVPTVVSDTKTLAAQIQEIEAKIHPLPQSESEKAETEDEIKGLHRLQDKTAQEKARINTTVAELEAKHDDALKRQQEIAAQQDTKTAALEEQKKRLKDVLGRDITIDPGPPVHYDAGSAPEEPWYGGTLAYRVFSRNYYEKWNAWKKAQAACRAFNAFQDTTGIELIQLEGQIKAINSQREQFNQALDRLNERAEELRKRLEQYTSAPWILWEDLESKRKQLARTAAVRTGFWLFDIPTLVSCLLTTAIAYSRMFLIAGRFGPRQLARIPT